MRIGFVFNPKSGRTAARTLHRRLNAAAARAGAEVTVIEPTSLERIEHLVAARSHAVDAMVAVGGDGTLNATINGILQSNQPDVPVGSIACGRGKDSVRTLAGLSVDDIANLSLAVERASPVDVGEVKELGDHVRYFINIAETGVGAEAARLANLMPRRLGSLSYTMGAAIGLLRIRATYVSLDIDGTRRDVDDAIAVIVCNGRSFGGGLVIAPMADPRDGQLEVVVVRRANLIDLGANLHRLRAGTPIDHPALLRWHGSRIGIGETTLAPTETDGEIIPVQHPAFTIRPNALTWISPV